MFKFKKVIGLATLVAIVAALGISSAALAQTSATPTPTTPVAPEMQSGGPVGPGLRGQVALAAAAKALGLTTVELTAQLEGGQTLADIASTQKVDIATVRTAVEAAEKADITTAIQASVTLTGTVTQAKADWLIEGLDQGYWGPGIEGGIGFGMEPGGRGGRDDFGGPNSVAPNSNGGQPGGRGGRGAPPSNGATAPDGTAF